MSDTNEAPKPVQYNRARGQVVACPPGWDLKSAGDQYDIQARAATVACFSPKELASFIDERSDGKKASMRIYTDERNRKITAIFDDADGGYEALRRDRATHFAEFSEELILWRQNDREWKDKNTFLDFLEDREGDITDPVAATLRTLVNELRLKKSVTWENTEKQAGARDVTLEFKTQSDQVGTVQMPEMITIGIPVFREGDKYSIQLRLRFQLDEGKIQFQVCLPGMQTIVDQAWEDSLEPFLTAAENKGWKVFAAVAPEQQPV